MSDEQNKLVRQSHEIAPAEDFARKIEERLRAEPVPQVEPERPCRAQYRFINGDVAPCSRVAQHKDGHGNANASWFGTCESVSPDGEPCVYQLQHEGDHGNGRDATWEQREIAPLGALPVPDFSVLGEVLKRSPAFQQMLAQRVAASRPIMQRSPLRQSRSYNFGFGPEDIPANGVASLTQKTSIYFRGEKLICDAFRESSPGNFDVQFYGGVYIDNLLIGSRLQPGFMRAAINQFNPNALGGGYRLDTAQPAFDITMQIRNTNVFPVRFYANLFGKGVV